MNLSIRLPKKKMPFRRRCEGLTVLQRMQLEEISELVNMLSALVPLAPTLLTKLQIAAIALNLLLVTVDLGTYVKPPLIP